MGGPKLLDPKQNDIRKHFVKSNTPNQGLNKIDFELLSNDSVSFCLVKVGMNFLHVFSQIEVDKK